MSRLEVPAPGLNVPAMAMAKHPAPPRAAILAAELQLLQLMARSGLGTEVTTSSWYIILCENK